MKKHAILAAVLSLACASAACFGYERRSTTAPSGTGVSALLGSWSSSGLVPSASSCTDFRWDITEQTGNSASGTFSATCTGDLRVNGTARGTLTGSILNWSAQATASLATIANCPIALTGTAALVGDTIQVPYSGDTCIGKVSGVETLRRR